MTNAHVVIYAHEIRIQQEGNGKKYDARVVGVCHERDLAVVEIEDESFACGVPLLQISEKLPKQQVDVNVFGYPIGGDAVSVTQGIVSRVEHAKIGKGWKGFRIQVDAALNPGNSGGPAVINSEIAGLVTSGVRTADNIGYLVSALEIQRFLADLTTAEKAPEKEDDAALVIGPGKSLRLITASMEHQARRDFFKIDDSIHGRQVVEIIDKSADSVLSVDDVILSIGGNAIDDDGNSLVDGLSIPMMGVAQLVAKDDSVEMEVLRDGVKVSLSVPLTESGPKLLQKLNGERPEYILYGPIAFTAVSNDLLAQFFGLAASERAASRKAALAIIQQMLFVKEPIVIRADDLQNFEGEELVMIANILKHRSLRGSPRQTYMAVKKVNDVEIKNLRHLAETLSQIDTKHVKIEFHQKLSTPLIVDHEEMLKATDDVMDENSIRCIASPGMSDAWKE